MKKYFAALGVTGLIAVAMPSTAMAGGALATELLPTVDAIDCAVATPCESNGFGATATLKIMGNSNMSFIMEGMLPNQTYHGSTSVEGCGNIVATFNSLGDGTANHTAALTAAPNLGDVVEVCRQDEFGALVPIYSGTLGRLNGR